MKSSAAAFSFLQEIIGNAKNAVLSREKAEGVSIYQTLDRDLTISAGLIPAICAVGSEAWPHSGPNRSRFVEIVSASQNAEHVTVPFAKWRAIATLTFLKIE